MYTGIGNIITVRHYYFKVTVNPLAGVMQAIGGRMRVLRVGLECNLKYMMVFLVIYVSLWILKEVLFWLWMLRYAHRRRETRFRVAGATLSYVKDTL